MGAPYVSIKTRRTPYARCDGCDRLTLTAHLSRAEGLRLCPSCALLYAVRRETYAGGSIVQR